MTFIIHNDSALFRVGKLIDFTPVYIKTKSVASKSATLKYALYEKTFRVFICYKKMSLYTREKRKIMTAFFFKKAIQHGNSLTSHLFSIFPLSNYCYRNVDFLIYLVFASLSLNKYMLYMS